MPLQPNYDLHSDSESLWVEGIGCIAQYHHWSDMLYSHGVIYFLRDYLFKDIEAKLDAGARPKDLRPLITRLNTLNSKISAYEAQECRLNHVPS